ncbi:uncharacterized protein LOC141901485 isoform X2 [Tubulanus polymorphus]|uniref:uncharacterized protein LOC141901485 isoform X2 n=1 Tax=Tubulanus polymorphus TaxID=672921 RepID=UPI003DA52BA8
MSRNMMHFQGYLAALSVVSIILQTQQVNGQLTQNLQDYIVTTHNQKRATEVTADTASNIYELKFDSTLAQHAQAYADKCQFYHDSAELTNYGEGENLGYRSSKASATTAEVKADVTYSLDAWYNEKSNYNYASNNAIDPNIQIGHYKQFVYHSATKIGCGYKFCTSLATRAASKSNVANVVCRYDKAVLSGSKPYAKGTPVCVGCNPGWCTSTGLCLKTCTTGSGCNCKKVCQNSGTVDQNACTCQCASGWQGTSCQTQKVCNDHASCTSMQISACDLPIPKELAPMFGPKFNGKKVKVACPKLCNNCAAVVGGSGSTTQASGAASVTVPTAVTGTNNATTMQTNVTGTNVTTGTTTAAPCTNPCLNGGTLMQKDCSCQCTKTFIGANCSTPANPNARCNSKFCQHGGQLLATCECRCPNGWQGPTCTESQNEAKSGVLLNLNGPISVQPSLWQNSMLWNTINAAVTDAVNTYCTTNDNQYKSCCAISSTAVLTYDNTKKYTSGQYIHTGQGFPVVTAGNGLKILIFVNPIPDKAVWLCTTAAVGRRRLLQTVQPAIKLPQDALLGAVQSAQTTIASDTKACCNVSYGGAAKAVVQPPVPLPPDDDTLKPWQIALIVIGCLLVVLLIVIIIVVLFNKSNRKGFDVGNHDYNMTATKTSPSGDKNNHSNGNGHAHEFNNRSFVE